MKPFIPLGTVVEPYGRVGAVGTIEGERYYWFVDDEDCVAMMPAFVIEPDEEKS